MTKTTRPAHGPCAGPCTILTPIKGTKGSDGPIPVEHFPCVWREFSGQVRRMVRVALGRLPLRKLWDRIEASCPGYHPLTMDAVRALLAADEALVEDVCQEIAIHFWQAINRRKVAAARPAVWRWFEVAIPRIVRRTTCDAVLLAALGPRLGESDRHAEAPALTQPPALRATASAGGERRALRALSAARPDWIRALSPAEQTVLPLWLEGKQPREIAQDLGLRGRVVRLRLMRARQRIAALASPNFEKAAA